MAATGMTRRVPVSLSYAGCILVGMLLAEWALMKRRAQTSVKRSTA